MLLPLDMNQVLEQLQKNCYHGKQRQKDKTTKKNVNSECWCGVSEAMGSESKMTKFLNDVVDTIKQVINGKFKAKQLVLLSRIFHGLH